MNENKKIIFLITEHNFLDQMTPIIELLYNNHYDITFVKGLHHYDYTRDNNYKYLKNNCKNLVIIDIFSNQNSLYKKYHSLYNNFNLKLSLSKLSVIKYFWHILAGLIHKYIEKKIIIGKNEIYELLKIDNNKNNIILITDIATGDKNYEKIRKIANKSSLENITFTHAMPIFKNELLTENQLELNLKKKVYGKEKFADKVVLFNSLNAKHTKEYYNCDVNILPSLRYTTKWINRISDESISFQNDKRYKLKMVFMLSTSGYNIWKEEEFRTIKALLLDKDIFLVIKLHPRHMRDKYIYSKIKESNFKVVANETNSSQLINWSDIVINIGSGIIMEAIIKNKIIFYMKYLHCNSIVVEDTLGVVHKITTRDELLILKDKYKNNKVGNSINLQIRKEFLKDFILNDDFKENQQIYLDFFSKV